MTSMCEARQPARGTCRRPLILPQSLSRVLAAGSIPVLHQQIGHAPVLDHDDCRLSTLVVAGSEERTYRIRPEAMRHDRWPGRLLRGQRSRAGGPNRTWSVRAGRKAAQPMTWILLLESRKGPYEWSGRCGHPTLASTRWAARTWSQRRRPAGCRAGGPSLSTTHCLW